ncbi:DUF5691 domain-containing protein [Streptacidiphilus cavernicola]|uniref:DUF5691 domain-containing protein n=1 Tax=Streptacidiphilus cavernicola TaxID=3342716 RepID=A0ABV6VTK0_9ACTN
MTAPQTTDEPTDRPTAPRTTDADWPELVTAALLGTDRRPFGDAPQLLDRAALQTVRRRAGLRPGPPSAASFPGDAEAPEDPRPPLPEPAARRFGMLLPGPDAPSGGSGSLANISELLPQYLTAAAGHGYRAPAAQVPPLLDAARARSELRTDAVALAGPLGRWLAERNPDWRYVLRTPLPGAADLPDERLWQEGLFAERVTHLTRLRRRDPAAARELLRSCWAQERAEDRLLFLDALQERLSAADEPFLESVLSDRSKNVRTTAAELLSTLPESALALRMAERARQAVRLAATAEGPRLTVRPPTACDAAMLRDGIPGSSPTGRADRAFWLGEVVAATPLVTWQREFGPPEQVLALPVSDTWAAELRDAWSRAAVRQNDAGWARALLAHDPAAGRAAGGSAKLLGVLAPAERAHWTAGYLDRHGQDPHGLGEAFQLLVACPAPWPEPLGDAVLRALARVAEGGGYPWSHSGVLGVAERALAPEAAEALDALAERTGSAWAEVFNRLAATLRLRAAMLAELAPGGQAEG